MPVTIDMKKVDWKQSSSEEDPRIEIRVPFVSTAENRARDLAVKVGDSQVLIVSLKGEEYFRWRLHDTVKDEVEFAVEDGVLVLDVEKKTGSSWPCLLCMMIPPTDPILLSEAELDRLLFTEYKPLPPVKKAPEPEAAAAPGTDSKEAAGEDDMDKLLDEAVEEAHAGASGDKKDSAAADGQQFSNDPFVQVELRGHADDEKEMQAKLKELKEKLEAAGEDEDLERVERHIALLTRMLDVVQEIREARTEPVSVRSFLKVQQMDLRKGRLNIGDTSEFEVEQFRTDEERALEPAMLMREGLKALQAQELEEALHFLRLAAIHHNYSAAACLLHRIYSEMGVTQRAAYFLLSRATDDKDLDPATNLLCGEMFDRGLRHFPPLMAMAVFFYQRAARAGSVNAMLSLAQIFSRGSCSVSFGTEDVAEGNKREPKFMAWLEMACSRCAGSAYFVMGSLYLRGEHGKPKDYAQAKFWIDKAALSQPEVMRRAPQINEQLQKLKVEQGVTEGGAAAPAAASKAGPTARVTEIGPSGAAAGAAVPRRPDAASRLAQVEQASAGGARSMMDPRGSRAKSAASGAGAASKRFWERTAIAGFGAFCVYTVAFPLRVMALPYFYMVVANLMDSLAGFGAGAPTARPRMF